MNYDTYKLQTPPKSEPFEDVRFCECGNRLHDVEVMCDDCLCELEDPQPKN